MGDQNISHVAIHRDRRVQSAPSNNLKPISYRRYTLIILFGFGVGYWLSSLLWTIQHGKETNCIHEHLVMSMETFISPSSKFVENTLDIPASDEMNDRGAEEESKDISEVFITKAELPQVSRPQNKTIIMPQFERVKTERKPLSPTWWTRYVKKLARIWHTRSVASWCATLESNPPTPILLGHDEVAEGMIYIKTYKASSSTCEGIAWSIAHHVGQRQRQQDQDGKNTNTSFPPVCKAYTRHEFADNRMHARRHPTQSLLWTFVRDPAARDLSHIYHFEIGRKNRTYMSSLDIQKQIQSRIKGRQTRYLVPAKTSRAPLWPVHELRKNRTELVLYMKSEIFDNYDFLGLTERMSESLAVMVLLWDLYPEDVIVLNSKRSGGFDDGGENDTCTVIPKAVMTAELKDYFATKHPLWNADVLLYHAANASLQMTIDLLGRDLVAKMVETIEALQQLVLETCLEEAFFPCSANGTFQPELSKKSCYVQDAGCGHECVDRVLSSGGRIV